LSRSVLDNRDKIYEAVSPLHEGILGYGGIAALILNLGPGWRCVISFISLPLYACETILVPTE
jgi:hypothetical protein